MGAAGYVAAGGCFRGKTLNLHKKFTQLKKIKYIKENSRARVGRPCSMQSAEEGSAGAADAAAGAARPDGAAFVLGAVSTGSVLLDAEQLRMVQALMPADGGAGNGTASGTAAGASGETSHGRRSMTNEANTNKVLAKLWSAIIHDNDYVLREMGVQLRQRCEWEHPRTFPYKMAVYSVYQQSLRFQGRDEQWCSCEAMRIACQCVTMTRDETWCQLRCGNPARKNLLVRARISDCPDMLGEEAVAEGVIAEINAQQMEIKLEHVVWVNRDHEKWKDLDPEIKEELQVAVVRSNPSVPAGWHVETISHRSAA